MKTKVCILCAGAALMLLVVWIFVVVPHVTALPSDFTYQSDMFSVDNFYDTELGVYTGNSISNSSLSYTLLETREGVGVIRTILDVRTQEDEPVFSAERLFGIDTKTKKHVSGYGDRDRQGYLFAPAHLQKQDFVFWHVSYDIPLTMKFIREERIQGLQVFKYGATFTIDSTGGYEETLGVPEQMKVSDTVQLLMLVEPKTGWLIDFYQNGKSDFYDVETGEYLHPRSTYLNRFTPADIEKHIAAAKQLKDYQILFSVFIPLLCMSMFAGTCVLFCVRRRKQLPKN